MHSFSWDPAIEFRSLFWSCKLKFLSSQVWAYCYIIATRPAPWHLYCLNGLSVLSCPWLSQENCSSSFTRTTNLVINLTKANPALLVRWIPVVVFIYFLLHLFTSKRYNIVKQTKRNVTVHWNWRQILNSIPHQSLYSLKAFFYKSFDVPLFYDNTFEYSGFNSPRRFKTMLDCVLS